MIVRMIGRFLKEKSDSISREIEDELDTQELINGDNFNRDEERNKLIIKHKAFDYTPIVFNLKDVMLYNRVDTNHTSVKFYNAPGYTFKITELQFSYIYQMFLGCNIMDFTQGTKLLEANTNTSPEDYNLDNE